MSLDDVSAYLKIPHRRQGVHIPASLWNIPYHEQLSRVAALQRKFMRPKPRPVLLVQFGPELPPFDIRIVRQIDSEIASFHLPKRLTRNLVRNMDHKTDGGDWRPVVRQILVDNQITLSYLRSPTRARKIVAVRRTVAKELRALGYSLPQIGKLIKRGHETVINLLGNIKSRQYQRQKAERIDAERTHAVS